MPKFCYTQQASIPIGKHMLKEMWKTAQKFSTQVQTTEDGHAAKFRFVSLLNCCCTWNRKKENQKQQPKKPPKPKNKQTKLNKSNNNKTWNN